MSKLTGKEKRALRARGQRLEPCASIGRAGLSPGAVENIAQFLARDGLIKVRMPSSKSEESTEQAKSLANLTNSLVIGQVGRSLLLYRPGVEPADNSA